LKAGKFIRKLVKSIRDENTFYLVLKKYKNSEETWDKIAWREIGRIVNELKVSI